MSRHIEPPPLLGRNFMHVSNALAGVAVRDLKQGAGWYERVIGEPGRSPMPEVVEWELPAGGCLQVFADKSRAGKSSVTLTVADVDAELARLKQQKVKIGKVTDSDQVKVAILEDDDGNQVVLAQAKGDGVAR